MQTSPDPHPAREEMIHRQLVERGIVDPRVLAALRRVPRERFVPEAWRDAAYGDRALPIDCGQTISQPYIVALMTEALELTGSERVLEVGAGSGYQAAVLAELAQSVLSLERHEGLAHQAKQTLADLGYTNVRVRHADGTHGCEAEAPFDRIIVTAATKSIPPALWHQLVEGGAMVLPLGDAGSQTLTRVRKQSGAPVSQKLCDCRFVPLIADGSPSE